MAETITEPGVYDIPEDAYHADPFKGRSLSQSGAKVLLDCPAKFRWQQDNPQPHKRVFDFGSAAHRMVLGAGPEITPIDADNWRTKKAKEAAEEARAAGNIPVLKEEYEHIKAMAKALKQHHLASILLDPDEGQAEQSLFWADPDTGINCRARLDWVRKPKDGVLYVPDYKTSVSASHRSFAKSCANYGYHQQDDWYSQGAELTGLADGGRVVFLFIVQEKTAPYVVSVFELDREAKLAARIRNREARVLYRKCVDSGEWPAYVDGIEPLSLPAWATRI